MLDQGWLLTILSSLLCVCGCFIIYFDDLYKSILPSFITSKYKFELKQNFKFLNGSLGFSAGCLLFTSLFKLLPESLEYFNKVTDDLDENAEKRNNKYLIFSYILGILICLSFNFVLHILTSESIVHCNHEGGEDHHDPERDVEIHHSHAHNDSQLHSHSHITEQTPLIVSTDDKMKQKTSKESLIHLITSHNKRKENIGECRGYSSAELCVYENPNANDQSSIKSGNGNDHEEFISLNNHDSQDTNDLQDHDNNNNNHNHHYVTPDHQLHYCEIPAISKSSLNSIQSPHSIYDNNTGLHKSSTSLNSTSLNRKKSLSTSLNNHSNHEHDHHHHINSPLSRLLLIGIQTTLAITLHKFPEGFITYITSETNPELGISIFLSLVFHNITEGFLMCLPLYYSFAESSSSNMAKLKAIGISGLLGGLSQPFGAMAGFFFLKFNNSNNDENLTKLNFIFGITLAITSGFLSVVGLSMYSTAVSFNVGSLNFVMIWCVIGICVIGLLSIVTFE